MESSGPDSRVKSSGGDGTFQKTQRSCSRSRMHGNNIKIDRSWLLWRDRSLEVGMATGISCPHAGLGSEEVPGAWGVYGDQSHVHLATFGSPVAPDKRTTAGCRSSSSSLLHWLGTLLLLQRQVHSLCAPWRKRVFEGLESDSKSSGLWSRESRPFPAPCLKLVFIYCCLCRSGIRELM